VVTAAFPLRIPVELERYDGGGEDELGNEGEFWGAPEEHLVFGWEPTTSDEPELAGHDRVVVDMKLYASRSMNPGPKDRMNLDGQRFEVIGYPQDPNNNPWWKPGLVTILLRRVEG
jgi:hypothetical protein